MPLIFENAQRLFRAGHYLDVVEQSDCSPRELDSLSPEHRGLIAYAMFQAGRIDKALEIANRERDRATGILRSRLELITGLVLRHKAQIEKALHHFNCACQLAREHRDTVEIAWTSLYRFRLLAQLRPADELAPLLAELRRSVALAGDAHAAAHMHNAVALMETLNGRPQEARRHLEISQSLIRSFPNAGLEQVNHISSFYVDFVECRYQSAIDSLSAARRLSSVTGTRESGVIDCNEGHLMMVLGRFQAAEALFRRVVQNDDGLNRFGALEGLARLYLFTEELPKCSEMLDAHETFLLHDRNLARALSGRWTAATRVRLLLKQAQFQEAADAANASLEAAKGLTDQILINELTCLLSEALIGLDRESEAAAHLMRLTADDPDGPGGRDATYYRALSRAVSRTDANLALELAQTARRIYHHQGNRSGEADIAPVIQALSKRPVTDIDVPALLLSAVASSLGNAESPRLVADNLVTLARLAGCSPRTELFETTSNRNIELKKGRTALRLGAADGKDVGVIFEEPRSPRELSVLGDVLKIGSAALSIQTFRRERREKAAVWPAEPVEANSGALFLAEEMQALLATARRVATTTVPVLITGETGTGKEVLARAIHAASTRAKATFLPFNCTSTPRDMLDSQLFGHRRGAFTGALEHFQGVIRGAAGGTLFLDEIGDMGLDVQPKLLRFLESSEVHPVGETQPVRVDVRIIAATNANLDALVADGRFREDLFYRLNIVRLHIPPLRERRTEIPPFANHYLQKYSAEYGKGHLRLAEETMEYLVLYAWPGNVRQLANEMRRMAALCENGAVVMPEHLSTAIASSRRTIPASERTLEATEVVVRLDQPLAAASEHLERTMLQYWLKQCGGRMEETAAKLGLSRKGLYLKRQRFGIEPPESATVGA